MPEHRAIVLHKIPAALHPRLRLAALHAGYRGLEPYVTSVIISHAEMLDDNGRAGGQTSPDGGAQFDFVVTGLTPAQLDKLLADIVDAVDSAGGTLGGGYANGQHPKAD